jgi:Tol biopolymer transport system component
MSAPDAGKDNQSLDPQAVREELRRIVSSAGMEDAERLRQFLTFVVEETLQGRGTALKESVIGLEVFGRPAGYDPKTDPVVRVQARRLRVKLEEYDRDAGPRPLRIDLPKGGYAPEFIATPAPAYTPPVVSEAALRRSRGQVFALAAAALLLVCVALLAMRGNRPGARPARIFTAYTGYQTTPAFSPDGTTLAFSWGGENSDNIDIYVQRLDADSPRRITTLPAAERRPSWLPDGQHIGFLRELRPGRMAVVVAAVLGGGERTIAEIQCNPAEPPSLAWSHDGRILYTGERLSPAAPMRIVEITLESGARRALSHPPAGIPGDDDLALSPDGRTIAFRRVSESALQDVFTVPATGGAERAITHDHNASGGSAFTRDGRSLVISSRLGSSLRSLWRYPIDGGDPVRITDPTEAAAYPAVSPRDGLIAYASRFLDANIWRIALDAQTPEPPHRIIASNLLDSCPHYSPDGARISFRSNRTGNDELWVADSDGGSPSRLTDFGGPVTGNARWSPDGQYLAIESRPFGNADLYLVPSGGGRPKRLTQDKSNEVLPSFTADGKSLYFASDRTGAWQIWKLPIAGGDARQITTAGGFAPLESPDGRWLYYTRRDTKGLFRMPSAGGKEETIVDSLAPSMWGGWGLAGDSVVYLDSTQVIVLNPATGEKRTAATLQQLPVGFDGAFGVSPDGKFAVVALVERAGSEIHLKPER